MAYLKISLHFSGGGFETSQHYPQWIRTFQNLERPSFLGESISRLYEACMDTKSSSWLLKLDASGWLTCVADLLKVTLSVANCIYHGMFNIHKHKITVFICLKLCIH